MGDVAARRRIVVLTGAGISAESGVPTFRGDDGLWEGHAVEDVATPEGFARNPALVHEFYNGRRRRLMAGIEPNAAHLALARLEREYDGEVTVVTQNIDDLHERAGSERLVHMHGELLKSRCDYCGDVEECRVDLGVESSCSCCRRTGGLRPHVVWFGEMPFEMDRITSLVAGAGLFLSIGTSGLVYPAAGLVLIAAGAGARTVEINLDESAGTSGFSESRRGAAGELVPKFVEELLAESR
jgi:NAD-dependent deacetylase